MKSRVYWSSSIVITALAVSPALQAALPVSLHRHSITQLKQSFDVLVSGSPRAVSRSDNTLSVIEQHVDNNKMTHVRLQQEYAGFPVFGGYGILHQTAGKQGRGMRTASHEFMTGVVYEGLTAELGQPSTVFVQHAQTALQHFVAQYSNDPHSDEQVIPMVFIDDDHRAFWAYKVSVMVQPKNQIPKRPTAIIDAKTGVPFLEWDDVKTHTVLVKGQGYGGNERVGLFQYGVNRPFLKLSRNRETGMCYMHNHDVSVVDMGYAYYSSNQAMGFSCGTPSLADKTLYSTGYDGDGYDEVNGAYSPSNDALYIGSVIKDMYLKWYGVLALMKNNRPMMMVMRVHYGEGYQNAFWDGQQMTFGDGGDLMYPLVSLSVGAHEISHGFTEQHANLNYFGQSGGINESFSDMAAQAADYYANGKLTWSVGADMMKESSGYSVLRYMDKPSRDGVSIDSADEYHPGMNVHYSSGVYNRLLYVLANQTGWDVRKAFHVMVKANMDYWTPYTTFDSGACGILQATADLGLSLDSVKQSLDAIAVHYDECEVVDS